MNTFRKPASKLIAAAAAFALGGSVLCTYSLRAADTDTNMNNMDKMDKDHMSVVTPDDKHAAMDQLDKIKQMAADPQQTDTLKAEMAKMMVMQHMAHSLSMDPDFQKAVADTMADSNVKKVHDDAETTSKDPDAMKNLKDQIMADPMAMKAVVHQAIMMNMMHEHMGDMNASMDDKK